MEGVTVFVTAYKSVDFIKECLDSISTQTYFIDNNEYEILIGIDGCIDTLNYLKTIISDYKNTRLFMMNENNGTYITSNTLIYLAKYNNLIRFDSDDIMKPNMVKYIMEHKGNNDIYRFHLQNFGLSAKKNLSEGVCFLKRNTILRYGGYRPWRCGGDSEIIKRLKKYTKYSETKEVLFLRRQHEESLTQKNGIYNVKNKDGKAGSYRAEKQAFIKNMAIHSEKEATIEMVTAECKELINGELINVTIDRTKLSNDTISTKRINTNDAKIIVSMTSWVKRIKNIPVVLDTILKQSKLPNKIVINLSRVEFPNEIDSFPTDVKNFVKEHDNLIEIIWHNNNIRHWKKTIPTMLKYPNDYVICIDDDRKYPSNFIEILWKRHLEYPNNPITINRNYKLKGKYLQHAGIGTLDKLEWYGNFKNCLSDDLYKLASSDSFFTLIANQNGYQMIPVTERVTTIPYNEVEPLTKTIKTASFNTHNEMFNFLQEKELIPNLISKKENELKNIKNKEKETLHKLAYTNENIFGDIEIKKKATLSSTIYNKRIIRRSIVW